MTPEALAVRVRELATAIAADSRWQSQRDDLGVSIVGMLLYGYALAVGRLVMLLEQPEIAAAVTAALERPIGAARTWSEGLVAEAEQSAFDKARHPGHFELIGVGHSYWGAPLPDVVDNVFSNIAAYRRLEGRAP